LSQYLVTLPLQSLEQSLTSSQRLAVRRHHRRHHHRLPMKIATFRPIGPRYAPGPPVVAPVCRLRSPIPSPPSADDIHPNPSPSTADVLPTPQSPSAADVCLVHRLRLPMASPDPLLPFAGNARPIRCLRPPLTSRLRPMLTSAAIRPRSPRGCAAAKLTPQKKDATASIRPHEHRLVYIIMHISSSLPSTGRCRTSFKKTSLFASIKSSQISAIFS